MPVHIPPLFHVVYLQIHVYNGSLKAASDPLHPMHSIALIHP
jgi:hypothetical protein